MIEDFQPRPRPSPSYKSRGPLGQPDNGANELPGFRSASVLPENSGDNLMPELDSRAAPAGPYQPAVLPEEYTEVVPEPVVEGEPVMPTPKKKASKKKKLLITLVILLTLGGLGFAAWWFGFRDTGANLANQEGNSFVVEESEVIEEDDGLVPSPLSGVDVSPADAARPVTAIMIENSGEARPQSGLREADVVFEAIAEGGITRFLALYQAKQPDYIGPVRSARPYYVEWARAFDASYAHAGGSPDGIARISQLGVKDLNAFAYGEDVFYRTSDRFAPHNLYSSFKGLDKANQQIGNTKSEFQPWLRKQDVPQAPTANKVDIGISSAFYNPSYAYDPAENNYKRSLGGTPHLDEKSGKQISPFVVLALVLPRSQSGIYSIYTTTGSGKFLAFQDGVASEGTWTRADMADQYSFKDKNGFDFVFNKGQVWVSVVTNSADVKFAP